MIITHTVNAKGQRRVYLGGKSSLECWVEPLTDGSQWSFRLETAVAGNPISAAEQKAWAFETLLALARVLEVPPDALADVPFERIAALHMSSPFDCRRVALPRSKPIENGFMSTVPGKSRAASDFVTARSGTRRS